MNWRSRTFLGWMLFGMSGIFFLIPAVRDRDLWALGAAVTWLFGVVLFVLEERAD